MSTYEILLTAVIVETCWLFSIYSKRFARWLDNRSVRRMAEAARRDRMEAKARRVEAGKPPKRAKPSEFCVNDDELKVLRDLPLHSVIRNGHGDHPNYFKKVEDDGWMPCNAEGKVQYALLNPIAEWQMPFRSDHIHADITVVREGIPVKE